MKRSLIVLWTLLMILQLGCAKDSHDAMAWEVYEEALAFVLPDGISPWDQETIQDAFENREIPDHVFSNTDQTFQVDFVGIDYPVEAGMLKSLHDFRVTRLNNLSSISDVRDDGIITLKDHEISQIHYYNIEKDNHVLFLMTELKSQMIYIRITYTDENKVQWQTYIEDFMASLIFRD